MVSLRPLIFLLVPSVGLCQETTGNLVDDSNWTVDGDVYMCTQNCTFSKSSTEYMEEPVDALWVYSDEEGKVWQQIDLSEYENIGEVTYGAQSFACNNAPDGSWCDQSSQPEYYDQITVVLNYGGTSYSDTVTLDYNEYFIEYEFSVEPNADADWAILSFNSIDAGLWNGYFASATHSAYMNVTYNVVEEVVTPIEVVVPVDTTDVVDLVVTSPELTMPDPIDVGIVDPVVDMPIDVTPVDTVDTMNVVDVSVDMGLDMNIDPIGMDMDVGAVDMPDMQIEEIQMADMNSMEPDMVEPEIVVELDVSDQEPASEELQAQEQESPQEPDVAQEQAPESEVAQVQEQPSGKTESSESSESGSEVSAGSESSNNIVVKINDMNMDQVAANFESAYVAEAQAVAVALMVMTAPSFESLSDARIKDSEFYIDRGLKDKKLKDRIWGSIYRDDKVWAEMVDLQYEYGN